MGVIDVPSGKRTDPFSTAKLEDNIKFHFQPIVHVHSGKTMGFEALIRNVERLGYGSIESFLDGVADSGRIREIELALLNIACRDFREQELEEHQKLFFNLDTKLAQAADEWVLALLEQLKQSGLQKQRLFIEVSERHYAMGHRAIVHNVKELREEGVRVVLDDFGTGICGAQNLFQLEPSLMKIDRFFIKDMDQIPKKRIFVSHLVRLAHAASVQVVAEGVETEKEFMVSRAVGCDYVQGYWVQRPTDESTLLRSRYSVVEEKTQKTRRTKDSKDSQLIRENMKFLPAVKKRWDGQKLMDFLNEHPDKKLFPLLNNQDEPVGIIDKEDVSEMFYSPFGKSLLLNPGTSYNPEKFAQNCPVMDIHSDAEKVLELYNVADAPPGVLFVDNVEYVGFLEPDALLRIVYEKDLEAARDQSPLTKLPGNHMVHKYVSRALQQEGMTFVLVYFDLMNFKPFNDTYGFRVGDRVLMLFADILQKACSDENLSVGHIGGDDFFLGMESYTFDEAESTVQRVLDDFRSEVKSFYNQEDRERGGIVAKARDGETRKFPLLEARAGVKELKAGTERPPYDEFMRTMAKLKKRAKTESGCIALEC